MPGRYPCVRRLHMSPRVPVRDETASRSAVAAGLLPSSDGMELGIYTFAELTPDPATGRTSARSSGCAT